MTWARGDKLSKTDGDYTFVGRVCAPYRKLTGAQRYIVEDDRGLNLIMSERQMKPGWPAWAETPERLRTALIDRLAMDDDASLKVWPDEYHKMQANNWVDWVTRPAPPGSGRTAMVQPSYSGRLIEVLRRDAN